MRLEKKPKIKWSSRQREILLFFLESDGYGTLGDLADRLGVSVRTLQRELGELEPAALQWGLRFDKKSGVGLKLEGDPRDREELRAELERDAADKTYSPEERQFVMKRLVLSSKEPEKLYSFSRMLNVTESTVSQDLNRIEPWLAGYGIRLERKPGIGVYIEGDEKKIRSAMADLLYEAVTRDQLMELLHLQAGQERGKLEGSIRGRLLNFIDPQWLFKIEQVIQDLERRRGYAMADTAYVGFVVHLALAVQRFHKDEEIRLESEILEKLKATPEYAMAEELAAALGDKLGLAIPESEVGYITMHLLGARSRNVFAADYPHSAIRDYVAGMISAMERELKLDLGSDTALSENLTTHLTSAVQRIELGMAIRNPLLGHVKQEYPDIFEATRIASRYLERQIGKPVPEEEIGYLAMHFGTAILRMRDKGHERRRALLVCSSGIGASRLLSVQLERRFPNLHVVDTISLFHMDDWLRTHPEVDLILSTMDVHRSDDRVLVVSPLLSEEDVRLVEKRLERLPERTRSYRDEPTDIDEAVAKVERYRKALESLIPGIMVFEGVSPGDKRELIELGLRLVEAHYEVPDRDTLKRDLEKREELGPVMLEDEKVAMLHCRSVGIAETAVCVLKLDRDVDWSSDGDNGEFVPIRSVLMMMGPAGAPQEIYQLISEISVALVEEEFTGVLREGSPDRIAEEIRLVLKKGYLRLAGDILR